jgi:hypothetical protein
LVNLVAKDGNRSGRFGLEMFHVKLFRLGDYDVTIAAFALRF